MAAPIKIFHNPDCGTSRNTLALIRNTGQEPEIIEYLKNPPTAEVLADMIQQAGLSVREAIRQNVTPYETLQLAERDLSDAELIALMVQHPLLINRPFVVTERGVKLCRPSELVLDLLTQPQLKAFRKEDGELVIDEHGQRVN
ncbi:MULTISPECIES: arsenate reductase (glutaredoxin) [Acinetobacter]|uniref:Arsenate reductase n=1 Tax=Acinetobacter indicus TaxID=756892 RepID=A0AAW8Z6B8_9GAMM|nr:MULTISPECIES: arsenate reductase (glutaredoxin) [Acinetobacter]MCO8088556.1 arsenate reductase (glutaredoxin) [Acinetobacter indicus]MCO8100327.1 arsenate reductase (glutaredoxin) [Acinetobacter indicus]MCO8103074.1 arsenate reductase (glutaredoxin) [Acinetobacter indicus]MCO8105820.1 arsenate reductase (glutaredoxin) [Acinetobacter indicus]MCO8111535.1 arsenate reductase (glutaredoxin) [Acinetobacter indicus]